MWRVVKLIVCLAIAIPVGAFFGAAADNGNGVSIVGGASVGFMFGLALGGAEWAKNWFGPPDDD
jgi:hypothetical protein